MNSVAPMAASSPGFRLAAAPSRLALAGDLAACVLAGRRVVVVKGQRGAGKTTLLALTATALRARGYTATMVGRDVRTALGLHAALAAAAGVDLTQAVPPDQIVHALLAAQPSGRVVLLLDDADSLPEQAIAYLDLLLQVTRFSTHNLSIVLFGGLALWPGLNQEGLEAITTAAGAPIAIVPLTPAESGEVLRQALDAPGAGPRHRLSRAQQAQIIEDAAGLPGHLLASAQALAVQPLAVQPCAVRGETLLRSRKAAMPAQGKPWLLAPAAAACVLVAAAGALRLLSTQPSETRAAAALPSLSRPNPSVVASNTVAPPLPPPPPPEAYIGEPEREPAPPVIVAEPAPAAEPAPVIAAGPAPPVVAVDPAPSFPAEAPPTPAAQPITPRRTPGLIVLAAAGDTMPALYSKVYRGVTPPPFQEVLAINPAQLKPGSLVVFPEPPGGWPRR